MVALFFLLFFFFFFFFLFFFPLCPRVLTGSEGRVALFFIIFTSINVYLNEYPIYLLYFFLFFCLKLFIIKIISALFLFPHILD